MFAARPQAGPPPGRDLQLLRAVRGAFAGPAEFLADPGRRARADEYLADLAGEPPSPASGHSYGEMAEALIGQAVSPQEPVDLLVLAFSIHDLWPGRQTAAFLSHLTPGSPMAFAVCDQGSAAAFTGLRIAREYLSSPGVRRALLIVVEQAGLPYPSPAPPPARHQGVAMLYTSAPDLPPPPPSAGGGVTGRRAGPPQAAARCATPLPGPPSEPAGSASALAEAGRSAPGLAARVADVRQHPGVPPAEVARVAAADFAELTAGCREPALVVSGALAPLWPVPAAARVRVAPAGQPSTGLWWGLTGELADTAASPGVVVAADYDPGLRYLCLTAFEAGARAA